MLFNDLILFISKHLINTLHLEFIFILAYSLFFIFLLYTLPFFKKMNIPTKWIIAIYLLKIIAGLAYNKFHLIGDAGNRAADAQFILSALVEHPVSVLKFLFLPSTMWDAYELQPYLSQFFMPDGFHAEFTLIRVYTVGMLLTGGYFNGVIPIVAFLILATNFNYFKLFSKEFPSLNKAFLLMIICLTPSLTFFTAGLYKEALIYIGLGLILTNLYQVLNTGNSWKRIVYILLGIYLIGLFRWVDLVLYLPVCLAYILLHKATEKVFLKYLGILLTLLAIGLFLDFLVDRVDVFQILDARKTITLGGNARSSFETTDWRGSGILLFLYLPSAIFNALFRPFIWNAGNLFQLVGGFETLLLFLLILFCLFYKKKQLQMTPFLGFLLFASISRLCFVGLFIENSGTIIRHRTEVLTFIIVFVIGYFLDTDKIKTKAVFKKVCQK